jgi:glyoxylase-like metal-dependent hydrolase (beta-lactamase superfamily II)
MLDTPQTPEISIGALTVTSLSDGTLQIPADYLPNASPAEREQIIPTTQFGANTWLIETGDRKVLVDAGSGTWLRERFPDTGLLGWHSEGLAERRAAITDIIISHMHADHIGGLSLGGKSLFPNAEVHIQAKEWTFWTDKNLPSAVPDDQRALIELVQMLANPIQDQIRQHSGQVDLGDGISLLPAEGHTPGHQIVHLSSGTDEVLLLADAVVSDVLQFANPDVTYALDSDPELAARTRKNLFDRIAADGIPFAATHLNTTGFCHLEQQKTGYSVNPL